MSISIISSQTLTEISMSSSLRSVMYMLAVDNLILVFSSIKTNNSIVQTFSLLVQNSFFFRGHLDLTLTTFRIQSQVLAVVNQCFLFKSEMRTWRCYNDNRWNCPNYLWLDHNATEFEVDECISKNIKPQMLRFPEAENTRNVDRMYKIFTLLLVVKLFSVVVDVLMEVSEVLTCWGVKHDWYTGAEHQTGRYHNTSWPAARWPQGGWETEPSGAKSGVGNQWIFILTVLANSSELLLTFVAAISWHQLTCLSGDCHIHTLMRRHCIPVKLSPLNISLYHEYNTYQ